MASAPDLHAEIVSAVLEQHKDALNDLSQQIWRNPEENFQEKFAHGLLTSFLEQHGFDVKRHYMDLETAFRAEFQSASFDARTHATVCVICEYDALPDIGHACGHNLIAEAGIAAGLAIKAVLENTTVKPHCSSSSQADRVEGRVIVMGTPAEEGGGGKILLIKAGAFRDIDFAMMVHPAGQNDLDGTKLGLERCFVEFHGKAAHASCGPWEGINALDAAVAAYVNVGIYRQQMKPDWRVHGIIVNGGVKANIIPDFTLSSYYMRTETHADLQFLRGKLVEIFNASAAATGCTVKINFLPNPYSGMIHCPTMARLYKKFAAVAGVIYSDQTSGRNGSTDMGNVSVELPSIHPGFYIGHPFLIHTREFQRIAGEPEAQKYTLIAAQSMALTCVELFTNPEVRDRARLEFQEKKKRFVG